MTSHETRLYLPSNKYDKLILGVRHKTMFTKYKLLFTKFKSDCQQFSKDTEIN